ncbi:MAG: (2Fe-2S) ferredoxin domain-containing protein [Polyangiaceae bacterium]
MHLFVCANRRDADSPLGAGCADAGEAVYAALKSEVATRGDVRRVWVTKTHCLGMCPKQGATVAAYPNRSLWIDVVEGDAKDVYQGACRGDAS